MQPTTVPSPTPRPLRLVAVGLLAGALLLAGCGSGGDDTAGTDTTAAVDDTGGGDSTGNTGSTGGSSDTTAVDDGFPDVDVCSEIPAEDIQALIPAADPITATTNEVSPAPTCDYTIEIGEGATAMTGAIVQIQFSSADPAYYTSQKELQTDSFDDVTDLAGVEEGFSFNGGGTILLTTDAGVWTVIRGIEVNKDATAQATPEEMEAIAELVEERL